MKNLNLILGIILANMVVIFLMSLDTNMNNYRDVMTVCYLLFNASSVLYFSLDELNEIRIVYLIIGTISGFFIIAMVTVQLYMLAQNY